MCRDVEVQTSEGPTLEASREEAASEEMVTTTVTRDAEVASREEADVVATEAAEVTVVASLVITLASTRTFFSTGTRLVSRISVSLQLE